MNSLAPEFSGITAWINSAPLTMASLRGHVVALEFWSRGCIHCVRAAPRMQQLVDLYGPKGFVLIGIHTPEVEEEKAIEPIKSFLLQKHLTYPVAVDSDSVMWNAYGNQYWPTLYLIDKQGNMRSQHVGEGGYQRIQHDIEHLLKE